MLSPLFFIRLRHPSRPPLFPYTTLFRSRLLRQHPHGEVPRRCHPRPAREAGRRRFHLLIPLPLEARRLIPAGRSEEHTSELQSRVDLVCRLLLEKKNRMIVSRTFGGRLR